MTLETAHKEVERLVAGFKALSPAGRMQTLVDDFRDWPYCSYPALLSQKETRLKRDEVLGWFDGPARFQAYHQQEISEHQVAPLVADDFD